MSDTSPLIPSCKIHPLIPKFNVPRNYPQYGTVFNREIFKRYLEPIISVSAKGETIRIFGGSPIDRAVVSLQEANLLHCPDIQQAMSIESQVCAIFQPYFKLSTERGINNVKLYERSELAYNVFKEGVRKRKLIQIRETIKEHLAFVTFEDLKLIWDEIKTEEIIKI